MDQLCDKCGRTHHPEYIHPEPGYDFHCMRCGHDWRTRKPNDYPKNCAKCHSSYYDRPPIRKSPISVVSLGKSRKRKRAVAQAKVKAKRLVEQSGEYERLKPPPSFGRVK